MRLPNCKHVFGDICIKKWCEDSDTCPYCRDKLPSELSVRAKLVAQARTSVQRVQLIRAQSRANAQLQEMATRRAEREANAGSLFDGPPSFDRYGILGGQSETRILTDILVRASPINHRLLIEPGMIFNADVYGHLHLMMTIPATI